MHSDVAALLAVQADDVIVHDFRSRNRGPLPRLTVLDGADCERAARVLAQAATPGSFAEQEERRRRDFESRLTNHRQLQEKHVTVLNTVTNQQQRRRRLRPSLIKTAKDHR